MPMSDGSMCRITIEVLQQEKRVAIESQMCYS